MPYYKIDYGGDDGSLVFTAMIDLPNVDEVNKKLEEYRVEFVDVDYEDSADVFVQWLNEHGIKAEMLHITGTILF
jgi:hypothetical protein